jgi:hypothetical protein
LETASSFAPSPSPTEGGELAGVVGRGALFGDVVSMAARIHGWSRISAAVMRLTGSTWSICRTKFFALKDTCPQSSSFMSNCPAAVRVRTSSSVSPLKGGYPTNIINTTTPKEKMSDAAVHFFSMMASGAM